MDIFLNHSLTVLTVALLLALIQLSFNYRRRRRSPAPFPPGPSFLSVIRNVFDIFTRDHPRWITFNSWSKIYGNIFHFNVFGTNIVVLNSYKVMDELLNKRSQKYSDRPDFHVQVDIIGNLWNLGSMRSSESWRTHRKILYNAFHPRVMPEYYADLRTGSIFLLRNIISSPENFVDHVSHYTATLALKLAYGYTELETNDNQYHVRLAHDMNDSLQSVVPGSFLVEYVPILRYLPGWFPGTSFKGKAVAWAVSINELKNKPWRRLKQAIDNGTSVPSFSTRNLEKFNVVITSGSEHTGMEEVIKCCAATIYGVGSDTTTSAIFTFILAMTLYIDVQKRAQDEIDRVVGTSRLPDFSDRDSLPFVNAVFSEVLRWNPVTPLGVSHRAREDDEYEGYSIPRNTTVVPNIWAALHDESLYGPNTMDFDPDRFLKHDVGKPLPPDPGNIAFGFGRRICPGRHLAESSLWITMTYLLATFNVAKEVDSQGQEVEPDVRYSEGLGSGPFPYKCRFIPRSSAAVKLVAN